MVCVGRHEDNIKETAEQISQFGHEALFIRADVSVPEDVERMAKETLSKFGKLDIAVNNAGIVTRPYRFHEMPLEDWERDIAVDLTGVFLCMQEECKAMLNQQGGSIINVTSVLGIVGMAPEFSPRINYVAAKHGVVGLTRQGAVEYAQDNVRVNAIAPGWFKGTGLSRDRIAAATVEEQERTAKRRMELIPMRRTGELEEIKGLIIYLASDASSYVTGQVFAIDGGWLAR